MEVSYNKLWKLMIDKGMPNKSDLRTLTGIGTFNISRPANKQHLDNIEKHKEYTCSICKFYKYCNGDCCQLQHDQTGCPGMKRIYEYILSNRKMTTI